MFNDLNSHTTLKRLTICDTNGDCDIGDYGIKHLNL